jgi:hypothetical protein
VAIEGAINRNSCFSEILLVNNRLHCCKIDVNSRVCVLNAVALYNGLNCDMRDFEYKSMPLTKLSVILICLHGGSSCMIACLPINGTELGHDVNSVLRHDVNSVIEFGWSIVISKGVLAGQTIKGETS